MGTFKDRWNKLRSGKDFRDEFIAAYAKQVIPYQIRALLKQQDLSQEELAERADLTQGSISRAANPTYGNLSVNTCIKIAAGFDVAFVGKFVPYSELDRWLDHLNEEAYVPTFPEEDKYAETLFAMFDMSDEPAEAQADGSDILLALKKDEAPQGERVLDFPMRKQPEPSPAERLANDCGTSGGGQVAASGGR